MVTYIFDGFLLCKEMLPEFALALKTKLATVNLYLDGAPISFYTGYPRVRGMFNTARLLSVERKQSIFPDVVAVALHYITWHVLDTRSPEEGSAMIAAERSSYVLPSLITHYKKDMLGTLYHVHVLSKLVEKLGGTPIHGLHEPEAYLSNGATGESSELAPALEKAATTSSTVDLTTLVILEIVVERNDIPIYTPGAFNVTTGAKGYIVKTHPEARIDRVSKLEEYLRYISKKLGYLFEEGSGGEQIPLEQQ